MVTVLQAKLAVCRRYKFGSKLPNSLSVAVPQAALAVCGGIRMNKNLVEKTKEWKQLERKTFEQRQIADEFYERNLMKLIEEDFIDRNKAKVLKR